MPKKTSDGSLKLAQLTRADARPPLLSEKLIARLQGAVEAAQSKRMPAAGFAANRKAEPGPNQ